MKTVLIFCLVFILISLPNSNYNFQISGESEEEIVPGKIIVKLKKNKSLNKSSQTSLSTISAQINATGYAQLFKNAQNLEVKKKLNLDNVFVMDIDQFRNVWDLVDELKSNPNVEYAEPVYLCKALGMETNDPLYFKQHHLPQIKAPEAWSIAQGDSSIVIGIIDSGVDWDHEDLKNVIWKNSGEIADNGIDDDNNGYIDDIRGWDFVNGAFGLESWYADPDEDGDIPDNNPMDFNGHGTHVTGIAAAQRNNEIGISSVASGVRIMPLRIGYHSKEKEPLARARIDWMAEAFIYAADNGADIANLSYTSSGQTINDAARYAFMHKVLVIEAAGNANKNLPNTLGKQSFVMSVASVNFEDVKAYYSNYGEFIDISAPGGDHQSKDSIISTLVYPSNFYNGKYGMKQGTSMAAPLVASLAGLVKSFEPDLSVTDLFDRIIGTADNIDFLNPNYSGQLGSGRVNVYRALTEKIYSRPNFIIVGHQIEDISGNNNGKLDPGENVTLNIRIRNNWEDAQNVTVSLSTPDLGSISINNTNPYLGNITGITDTSNWERVLSFNVHCDPEALPVSTTLSLSINSANYTQILEHYLSISPRTLLVADFEQANGELFDFSSCYIDAFLANRISFDFVHHLNTKIDFNLLSQYKIVVWACELTDISLNEIDRLALRQFLDNGGSLFLTGQNIAKELYKSKKNQDRSFLQNYLKIDFKDENTQNEMVFGIENDSISDGMKFNISQSKRDLSYNRPDIIEPIEPAESIFETNNGKSVAIRYCENYRLIFFGFGGIEAISDMEIRNTLIPRVINYLDGIEIDHTPLKFTDITLGEYLVKFSVTSQNDPIDGVILCWNNNNIFKKVAMTNVGNSNFQGAIPAHPLGNTVEYFAYVETGSGNYSFSDKHTFDVDIDNEEPTIVLLHSYFEQSINSFGPAPYNFNVLIDDNMGVDTSATKIIYWFNENSNDSTLLTLIGDDEYTGTFSFEKALTNGDNVKYFFKSNDISSNKNFAASDTFAYKIDTSQIVDDFEHGTWLWDLGNGWGVTKTRSNRGEFSITDSPLGDYQNNSDNPLTLRFPFNLSMYKSGEVRYHLSRYLESEEDSLFFEISNDGGQKWDILKWYTSGKRQFSKETIDISYYTGEGNENIIIRFRVKADEHGRNQGVYIDDVIIKVSFKQTPTDNTVNLNYIPKIYTLEQNYPNPFNPSTKIKFGLPNEGHVSLIIYNVLGEELGVLVNDKLKAGFHEIKFNNVNYSSGIYFYRLQI